MKKTSICAKMHIATVTSHNDTIKYVITNQFEDGSNQITIFSFTIKKLIPTINR
jgi:hypothetical protein